MVVGVAQITLAGTESIVGIVVGAYVPVSALWNAWRRRVAAHKASEAAKQLAREVSEEAQKTAAELAKKHSKDIQGLKRTQKTLAVGLRRVEGAQIRSDHKLDQIGEKLEITWENGARNPQPRPEKTTE